MNEADEYSLMMEDTDFVNESTNNEYTKAFKEGVTEFKKSVSACKKANKAGEKTENIINLYRNKLLQFVKDFRKQIDKMEQLVNKN